MYSTLLWHAHYVCSQLVIVVFVVVLVPCDLQCLVIVTIIYGGRTLNMIVGINYCTNVGRVVDLKSNLTNNTYPAHIEDKSNSPRNQECHLCTYLSN